MSTLDALCVASCREGVPDLAMGATALFSYDVLLPQHSQAQFKLFWGKYGVWKKKYAKGLPKASGAPQQAISPDEESKWAQNHWTSKMLAAKAGNNEGVDQVKKVGRNCGNSFFACMLPRCPTLPHTHTTEAVPFYQSQ